MNIFIKMTHYTQHCSSISEKNIHATQFHPEKSGKVGLEIYKNFLNLV